MDKILDFNAPLDVAFFDEVVKLMSTGSAHQIMEAQEVLTKFKVHPDAFLRVDKLLTGSQSVQTRFFALQVLDETIMRRWNTLGAENQQAVRNFVLNLIVQECKSTAHIRQNKMLLTKMNTTLVSIAKREWPVRWPNFVQDIYASAGPNDPMVENNLSILKLLAEEVFEFGEKTMTTRWRERKKVALAEDLQYVMQLCTTVIANVQDPMLLKTAFATLATYVPWMEPKWVYSQQVLQRLAEFLVPETAARPDAVRCFTEMCAAQLSTGAEGEDQARLMIAAFRYSFETIINALPSNHSSIMERLVCMYDQGNSVTKEYCFLLHLLLIAFLRKYYAQISYDDLLLVSTHEMLVGMSHLDDKELFKSCIEYWNWMAGHMLKAPASGVKKSLMSKLARVMSDVRFVVIRRMAKPEEVIVVVEDGEVIRQQLVDVEELQLYSLMQQTLISLTLLDSKDTKSILVNLMNRQADLSEWSWDNCNTLSWAVGSVSNILPEAEENDLFVNVLQTLLKLCKEMSGKENRCVIASDIMFVAGQYHRYLRTHRSFLKTVTRKVFEFMWELFAGVQDMAVETFLRLAKNVGEQFSIKDGGSSFAMEIALTWTKHTAKLAPPQIELFFNAVGYIIVKAELEQDRKELLMRFLDEVNAQFKAITAVAAQAGDPFCRDTDSLVRLLHYLRIFSNVAESCGSSFITEMDLIITDLYGFYKLFAGAQSSAIRELGEQAVSRPDLKYPRLLKKEILRIFEHFVTHASDFDFIATYCMPDILGVVLTDYQETVPAARDAGVLALVAACVKTLGRRLENECGAILDRTFNCTVEMIAADMASYPELRVNLFKLLQSLNEQCFDAFVYYASTHENVLGGMMWAIQHTDFPTMSTGLETLDLFLDNVANSSFVEPFYTSYIQRILTTTLVAAMDGLHAAGFPWHCRILQKLFVISSMVPTSTPVLGREPLEAFILQELQVIPTLTPSSISTFVEMAYNCINNADEFKTQFSDFLIEVNVWGAEEENKLQQQEEQRKREETISGFSSLSTNEPINPFRTAV